MDCDGVVWQGDTLLPGVRESIALLRESGKRLVFVTNNSNKSRREYVHKFEKLGISVEKEEVFSAAFAAAAYLKTQGMKKKAYVVGGRGVVDELNEMQIEVDPGVFNAVKCTEADWEELIVDEDVGAVIVGQDVAFTYAKLAYAAAIQRGATFVATNPDAGDAIGPGLMPGAGAIVAAVEKASGVAPEMYAGEAERVPAGAAQGELRRHGEDPRRGRQAGHRRRVRQGGGAGVTVLTLSGCPPSRTWTPPSKTATATCRTSCARGCRRCSAWNLKRRGVGVRRGRIGDGSTRAQTSSASTSTTRISDSTRKKIAWRGTRSEAGKRSTK